MQGDWSKCNDVNLTKFLRTLLLPNSPLINACFSNNCEWREYSQPT